MINLKNMSYRLGIILFLFSTPHFFYIYVYKVTIWIDSIFHVAFTQAILSKQNYILWYSDRGFTHYTHEGLGFSSLWHLMPVKYHWFAFALTQHTISILAICFLYYSLNRVIKSNWNLFFCFCLSASPYLMFFDSSYMTESIAKSALIFSIGLFILFHITKDISENKYLIFMLLTTLIISQFRLYWGGFIIILVILSIVNFKNFFSSSKKLLIYLFLTSLIININSIFRYVQTDDFTIYYSGPSKIEKLLQSFDGNLVEPILASEFKKFVQIDPKFLKNNSFHQTLTNPDYSVPFYKHIIINEKVSASDIDFFLNGVMNKINKKKIFLNQDTLRAFLNTSGFYKLSISDKILNSQQKIDQFNEHWYYLSKSQSKIAKEALAISWFNQDNGIWNLLGSRQLIFDNIYPYVNSFECGRGICEKIKNIVLFSKNVDVYLFSIIGLLSIILIYFLISYRLGLSLFLIIFSNSLISSITLLSDPRIMMPAFICYAIGITLIFSYISQKITKILFRNS